MIPKALRDITFTDIEALVANSVPESRTLEYKETLPGSRDEDKREFLYDVSALANGGGGDIVYGVAEDGATGVPNAVVGLPRIDAGTTQLRMEQLLQAGVAPRIPGISFKFLDGAASSVLVVRVPQSWIAPHMVILGGLSRFYSRAGSGKYQLDVQEIRSAFLASEGVTRKLQEFRDRRLGRILADVTAVPLASEGRLVVHVCPVSTTPQQAIFPDAQALLTTLPMINASAWSGRFNADGYAVFAHQATGAAFSYTQLFRDFFVEAVEAGMFSRSSESKVVPGQDFDRKLVRFAEETVARLREWEVSAPLLVTGALLNLQGWRMALPSDDYTPIGAGWSDGWNQEHTTIDRQTVILPDVLIDDGVADLRQQLRPLLDGAWQASGVPRSASYDAAGQWKYGN